MELLESPRVAPWSPSTDPLMHMKSRETEHADSERVTSLLVQLQASHAQLHTRMVSLGTYHTPSIAFRHLPPNSARTGYATVGALFISAQLSTDAVSVLRKVCVLIRLWKQHNALARP